jgi:glycosyltransferase involved in cell wall biosynthesis
MKDEQAQRTMPKGNDPLISIIIPTLNEGENIAACLASTQNAPDVERIVVDGGSKDRTLQIARSCGAKAPPLFGPGGEEGPISLMD